MVEEVELGCLRKEAREVLKGLPGSTKMFERVEEVKAEA